MENNSKVREDNIAMIAEKIYKKFGHLFEEDSVTFQKQAIDKYYSTSMSYDEIMNDMLKMIDDKIVEFNNKQREEAIEKLAEDYYNQYQSVMDGSLEDYKKESVNKYMNSNMTLEQIRDEMLEEIKKKLAKLKEEVDEAVEEKEDTTEEAEKVEATPAEEEEKKTETEEVETKEEKADKVVETVGTIGVGAIAGAAALGAVNDNLKKYTNMLENNPEALTDPEAMKAARQAKLDAIANTDRAQIEANIKNGVPGWTANDLIIKDNAEAIVRTAKQSRFETVVSTDRKEIEENIKNGVPGWSTNDLVIKDAADEWASLSQTYLESQNKEIDPETQAKLERFEKIATTDRKQIEENIKNGVPGWSVNDLNVKDAADSLMKTAEKYSETPEYKAAAGKIDDTMLNHKVISTSMQENADKAKADDGQYKARVNATSELNAMMNDPSYKAAEITANESSKGEGLGDKPKQYVKTTPINNDGGLSGASAPAQAGNISLFSIGLSLLIITGAVLLAMILNIVLK